MYLTVPKHPQKYPEVQKKQGSGLLACGWVAPLWRMFLLRRCHIAIWFVGYLLYEVRTNDIDEETPHDGGLSSWHQKEILRWKKDILHFRTRLLFASSWRQHSPLTS